VRDDELVADDRVVDEIRIEDDWKDPDIGNVRSAAEAGKVGEGIDSLLDAAANVFSAPRTARFKVGADVFEVRDRARR
jgi:hypothetical protein